MREGGGGQGAGTGASGPAPGWLAASFKRKRIGLALRQARFVVVPLPLHSDALLKRHRLPFG